MLAMKLLAKCVPRYISCLYYKQILELEFVLRPLHSTLKQFGIWRLAFGIN